MRFLNSLFTLLLLVCSSCTIAQSQTVADGNNITKIKENFISNVASQWESFSICEHRDRSNKNTYLDLLIRPESLPKQVQIKAQHFLIRSDQESSGVDLSIYLVQFDHEEAAKKAFKHIWRSGSAGSVADGKVLTRFAAQHVGRDILILRTQSFLDPPVKAYFDSFAK